MLLLMARGKRDIKSDNLPKRQKLWEKGVAGYFLIKDPEQTAS